MLQLRTELINVVTCLEQAQVDYALCGGLAVAVHGYPRATKDIDILIRSHDLDQARAALKAIGFDLEAGIFQFEQGTDRERSLFRTSKSEGAVLTTLDLMLVTPVLEDVWRNRGLVRAFDKDIKVVSKPALIKMKQLANRLQDLADIEALGGINEQEPNGNG